MSCSKEVSASSAPAAQPMTSPVGKLKSISDKQMKTITSRISGSVETQLLVIAYLDELDDKKSGVPKLSRKKSAKDAMMICDGAADDDDPGFTIATTETLNRHHGKYSGWKKATILSLCSYCEPGVFPPRKKQTVDSASVAKQLLEKGWDIDTNDKTSDRPSSLNKKQQFESLRAVYITSGRPLRNITIRDGVVNWDIDGCYEVLIVEQQTGKIVQLHDKVLDKVRELPKEWIEAWPCHDWKTSDIQRNWSHSRAFVQVPDHEPFSCAGLFPMLRRRLVRNVSEEEGAVARPGEHVDDSARGNGGGGNGGGKGASDAKHGEKKDKHTRKDGDADKTKVSKSSKRGSSNVAAECPPKRIRKKGGLAGHALSTRSAAPADAAEAEVPEPPADVVEASSAAAAATAAGEDPTELAARDPAEDGAEGSSKEASSEPAGSESSES